MTIVPKSEKQKNTVDVYRIMKEALSEDIKDFNGLESQIRQALTDAQLEEIVEKAVWYWPRRLALNELWYRELRRKYPDFD